MVGFGPPARRQARREWWRRQIQRQEDGGLTVAEFCRRLGVSRVTFYAWKVSIRPARVERSALGDHPDLPGRVRGPHRNAKSRRTEPLYEFTQLDVRQYAAAFAQFDPGRGKLRASPAT